MRLKAIPACDSHSRRRVEKSATDGSEKDPVSQRVMIDTNIA